MQFKKGAPDERKILVLKKSELRKGAEDLPLDSDLRVYFPISRVPLERAHIVVIHEGLTLTFLKYKGVRDSFHEMPTELLVEVLELVKKNETMPLPILSNFASIFD